MPIILDEPTTPNTPKAPAPPISVNITLGEPSNGRLPVAVTVIPLADLDARGGVFVDFQIGAQAPEEVVVERTSALALGDRAVAAMVAREAAASAVLPEAAESNEPEAPTAAPALEGAVGPVAAAEADPAAKPAKPPFVSHQIAKAIKLTVGQAETFRAEVATPVTPLDATQGWFMRGRFSTLDGEDLSSAWLPL